MSPGLQQEVELSLFARLRRQSRPPNNVEAIPGGDAPAEGTGDGEAADDSGPGSAGAGNRAGRGRRRIAAAVLSMLAVLLLLVALVGPNTLGRLTPGAFLRIPVEGLTAAAVLLVLPNRARRVVAVLLGAVLGLLTVLKLLDIGYSAALGRQFDPVLDWALLDDATSLLGDSIGAVGAGVVAILAAALAVALPVLMALAMLRLARLVTRRSAVATRTIALLTVVWVGFSLLGTQIVPGVPVASFSAATAVADGVQQVGKGLADQRAFAVEVTSDAYRDVPGEQLLTGLRGKDVIIAFIESYGRTAVESPEYAQVAAALDEGNRQLAAAGLGARSAWLTSSTSGGYSWLAHSTLMSGLWIHTQQRYDRLLQSDRLTLNRAFERAGWRTVGFMPALTEDWPEGQFYGYEQLYDSRNVGYNGPRFSYSTMPDQFTLAVLERTERAANDRRPVMAEMALVSSHGPWTPIPELIDWNVVGDGSVFGPMAERGPSPEEVWRDPTRLREFYGRSLAYSVGALVSYMQTYGDENTVLIFLGDHEPAPFITGEGAGKDVPITIVARDPAVLEQISGWGWQEGIKPGPQNPVWPMDAFRDRFLGAFGGGTNGAGTH